MSAPTCERCQGDSVAPLGISAVSFFNTQTLCLACIKEERAHPQFEHARQVEVQHVNRGNFNFEGIGLPEDLLLKYPHSNMEPA